MMPSADPKGRGANYALETPVSLWPPDAFSSGIVGSVEDITTSAGLEEVQTCLLCPQAGCFVQMASLNVALYMPQLQSPEELREWA